MSSYRIILLFFVFLPTCIFAQKLGPKWYGRAEAKTSGTYNSYLCEMVIRKKGNQVNGNLNYFFGQNEYNVKISGEWIPATGTIELKPFNLITYFSGNQSGPDCQMDGSLTLYTDGSDSLLFGQLNPTAKYSQMCPVLDISFRKEIELLFVADTIPEFVLQSFIAPVLVDSIMPPPEIKEDPVVLVALNKREFLTGPLLEVESDIIYLRLYDNGQVDNDTVSLFFNRKPIALKQKLGISPIIIPVNLEPGENEISMFADNLGDIPPNTALCIINAGNERFTINLTSTLNANGTVRIRRKNKK